MFLLLFYRYFYYRLYSFFDKLRSPNSYGTALVILTLFIFLAVFKTHSIINWFIQQEPLRYEDIVIPYIVIYVIIYAINYALLQMNDRYITYEARFANGMGQWNTYLIVILIAFVVYMFI